MTEAGSCVETRTVYSTLELILLCELSNCGLLLSIKKLRNLKIVTH